MLSRRLKTLFSVTTAIAVAACMTALGACSTPRGGALSAAASSSLPPIVFVHGNGDSAALWQTTLWRFESNGWPRSHLHAIDVPYPLARDDDTLPQAGRTSTAEHMAYLSGEVDKVLKSTGAAKVVLFANSRGGNAVRNYIANGGGVSKVSHAILGGTPNHGVWAIPGFRENNEFAGTGRFLSALNAPKNAGGDEVTPGVKWATIRSDNNDKFAQPDGLWIGRAGSPTFVTHAGPELKGATNIVIARIDHRETSFGPAAFAAAHSFVTGHAPKSMTVTPEVAVVLNGQVTGLGVQSANPASGNFVNNLPVVGAQVEVFAIDPVAGTRLGTAAHRKTVGADGIWGPFAAQANAHYEFAITAAGYATTHIYRSPFVRSSTVVHLRAERLAAADKTAGAIVSFFRPRGYFDASRDTIRFDGLDKLPGIPARGAGLALSKIKFTDVPNRVIAGSFNGETVAGRAWPAAQGHLSVLELHQ